MLTREEVERLADNFARHAFDRTHIQLCRDWLDKDDELERLRERLAELERRTRGDEE